jgi:hypothetical protein
MRLVVTILAVYLAIAPDAPAQSQDAARAIIDKAIEAQGGEKQVAKQRIMHIKVEGKVATDQARTKFVAYVVEDTWQLPGQFKSVRRMQEKDAVWSQSVEVIDGAKGWRTRKGKVTDIPRQGLANHAGAWQMFNLDRLWFLSDQRFELSVLDEIKVEGKPAVGVLVQINPKGPRVDKLYFDKSSGLLVKWDQGLNGSVAEIFYSDYQEKGGLKHYRKKTTFIDGKLYDEGRVTELQFFDRLDPKMFAKPLGADELN